MMKSAIYSGWVHHLRHAPRPHAFRYRVFMPYLDLDELPELFDGRLLWSARRPALAWFRRADHLGDPTRPLDLCVRDLVEARTGQRPAGPVRLLTHLRYFGYCMNPVSFYYCYAEDGETLEHVVAEVSNTPWDERHCYVLDAREAARDGSWLEFAFDKAFHVSPFMRMDQRYQWRFTAPGDRLGVHMRTVDDGVCTFEAGMGLEARPVTAGNLARALARHPFMTGKVIGAIYLQALRLWLKGVPFHEHPKHRLEQEAYR